MKKNIIITLFMAAGLWLHPINSQAALLDDLNGLVAQTQALDTQLQNITLTGTSVCGPLVAANQAARDLVNNITQIDQGLAAPLQVDVDILTTLNQLAALTPSLAGENLRLSVDLQTLSQTGQAITIKDGIVAMLQLSDDIGTMADRIGEMASLTALPLSLEEQKTMTRARRGMSSSIELGHVRTHVPQLVHFSGAM